MRISTNINDSFIHNFKNLQHDFVLKMGNANVSTRYICNKHLLGIFFCCVSVPLFIFSRRVTCHVYQQSPHSPQQWLAFWFGPQHCPSHSMLLARLSLQTLAKYVTTRDNTPGKIARETPQWHFKDKCCVSSHQSQTNRTRISMVITLWILLTKYQTITFIVNSIE